MIADNTIYILFRELHREIEVIDVFTDFEFACDVLEGYREVDESRENHEEYYLEQHFITHRQLPETIEEFDEINDII